MKQDWWCRKHNKQPNVEEMLAKCSGSGHICSKLYLKVDARDDEIPSPTK